MRDHWNEASASGPAVGDPMVSRFSRFSPSLPAHHARWQGAPKELRPVYTGVSYMARYSA